MATIKIEIKNGKAVELNPYGKQAPCTCVFPNDDMCTYPRCKNKWEAAEAARKVYEIENAFVNILDSSFMHDLKGNIIEFGSIHDAELINETTVKLIS